MVRLPSIGLIALLGSLVAGCAGPAATPSGREGSLGRGEGQPGRTLVVAGRAELPDLSPRPFRQLGLTSDVASRMFNAGLTTRDDAGIPIPYLAEAVPQLNTDTWRVFPDGTMQTMYRLKPNAMWHDGQPVTADDFVFAYRVYWDPLIGLNSSPPGSLIDQVSAPDPRTVMVRWKATYPEAAGLSSGSGGSSSTLPPLPKHLLEHAYQSQDAEAFMANPFWTQTYVGAGPYKLERWEPGAFIEGMAFDQHILGKPRIPRIRQLFVADPGTVMANLLAGEVALTAGDSIRFTDGETLRQQWGDRGQILNGYTLYRITQIQRKPEYASTLAFTDVRVRKALHHGVDVDTLNEALQAGRTRVAHGPIPPNKSYYANLERAVAKYPYDPRRVEQLMTEAGFSRGADRVWAHPDPRFGRMAFENNVFANPESNAEMSIMADTWRQLGFDNKEVTWAPVIASDREARNTFPGLSTTSTPNGEKELADYYAARLPTAQNQWRGSNRGAWAGTSQFDRLVEVFETSLVQNERTQAVIEMARLMTEDVVHINLYWKLNAVAFVSGLTGPRITDPDGSEYWNLHQWEFV